MKPFTVSLLNQVHVRKQNPTIYFFFIKISAVRIHVVEIPGWTGQDERRQVAALYMLLVNCDFPSNSSFVSLKPRNKMIKTYKEKEMHSTRRTIKFSFFS